MNFYHKLLEIPEAETPPDHYGLVGVPRFTDDTKEIHAALVARNTQLRAWDNSKFFREANALLDEVVAAAFILEDPIKKAAYDAELSQSLGIALPSSDASPETAAPAEDPEWEDLPELPKSVRAKRSKPNLDVPKEMSSAPPRRTSYRRWVVGAMVSAVVLIAAVGLTWSLNRDSDTTLEAPVAETPTTGTESETGGGSVPGASPNAATTPGWDVTSVRELKVLTGHTDQVVSVAITPDGRSVASGGTDHAIKLWDTRSGQESRTLAGHANETVMSMAFTPDGQTLISSGNWTGRGTTKLWDMKNDQGHRTLRSLVGSSVVALSPDGKTLVWGTRNGSIDSLDIQSGQERPIVTAPARSPDSVWAIAFSRNGKTLASGIQNSSSNGSSSIKLWDVQSGKLQGVIPEYTVNLAFSPDGVTLAGCTNNTIKLWHFESGQELHTLQGHSGYVSALAFLPGGRILASGSQDKTIKLWDTDSGRELHTLTGHTDSVNTLAVSRDGLLIVSGGQDKTIRLWGSPRNTSNSITVGNAPASASTPATSNNLTVLALAETKPDWSPANVRESVIPTGHLNYVYSAVFSPDGKRLASASSNGMVVFNTLTGPKPLTLRDLTQPVNGVAFSPDGRRLALAIGDGTVRVWNAMNGKETLSLKGHTGSVNGVAFSPDGNRLASAGQDRTVKVWNATSGQETHSLTGHSGEVTSVVYSADGNRLASASQDRTVKVWNATGGRATATLSGHTGPVNCVAFTTDGNRLASASVDGTVKVWDATRGRVIRTLNKHTDRVWSVAFSVDGKWLASACQDRTIKVWDATSGQEIRTLKGHTQGVRSVAFSPDGNRLVSASADSTVRLWDATPRP